MSASGGNPALSIVPDDVAALGKYAYDLADTLRSALANAGHEVDALTGRGWSGAASASFAKGWSECQDGGGRIIDARRGWHPHSAKSVEDPSTRGR